MTAPSAATSPSTNSPSVVGRFRPVQLPSVPVGCMPAHSCCRISMVVSSTPSPARARQGGGPGQGGRDREPVAAGAGGSAEPGGRSDEPMTSDAMLGGMAPLSS